MSAALKAIRIAVFARAAGRCEGCGGPVTAEDGHLDHVFGRANAESVETCMGLCVSCDNKRTANHPARAVWLRKFVRHAQRYGYLAESEAAEALIEKAEAKGFA